MRYLSWSTSGSSWASRRDIAFSDLFFVSNVITIDLDTLPHSLDLFLECSIHFLQSHCVRNIGWFLITKVFAGCFCSWWRGTFIRDSHWFFFGFLFSEDVSRTRTNWQWSSSSNPWSRCFKCKSSLEWYSRTWFKNLCFTDLYCKVSFLRSRGGSISIVNNHLSDALRRFISICSYVEIKIDGVELPIGRFGPSFEIAIDRIRLFTLALYCFIIKITNEFLIRYGF